MGHSKVHKANKLIRDKSFYKIVEDLKLCFSHHEMAWELAELLKDVVTGNPVPSTKYQGNLSRLKQYYYELSQDRKHDTDCDRTVASLVCSDCETMLWADNERLAKLKEMNE